jgi:hypothetical protein
VILLGPVILVLHHRLPVCSLHLQILVQLHGLYQAALPGSNCGFWIHLHALERACTTQDRGAARGGRRPPASCGSGSSCDHLAGAARRRYPDRSRASGQAARRRSNCKARGVELNRIGTLQGCWGVVKPVHIQLGRRWPHRPASCTRITLLSLHPAGGILGERGALHQRLQDLGQPATMVAERRGSA